MRILATMVSSQHDIRVHLSELSRKNIYEAYACVAYCHDFFSKVALKLDSGSVKKGFNARLKPHEAALLHLGLLSLSYDNRCQELSGSLLQMSGRLDQLIKNLH